MRRIDDKKDGGDRLAGLSPAVSGPPLGPTVIPFRKAETSAVSGFADDGTPPVSSSPPSIGPLVHAVVMRIANKRTLRIQAIVPAREEDSRDDR